MTFRTLSAALAAAVLLPVTAGAQTAKRPFALDDLGKFKSVSDPQISPDGAWIAYTVGSVDIEKDKRDSDVWMVSWDGTQTVQLTSSKDSESRPAVEPGRQVPRVHDVATATRTKRRRAPQVWLLNRNGGEAQKLTDVKGGVDDYEWSPDSTRLVLVVSDPDPSEDPEKIEGWKKKTKPPIVIDRYQFKRDYAGYLQHLRDHLYLFDIATKKVEPLTSGDYDDRSPVVVARRHEGRVCQQARRPIPIAATTATSMSIDAKAGATPRQLTTYTGEDGGRPAWSPDGSTIAYLQSDEAKWYAYDQTKLALIPAAGGTARLLTESLDRAVGSPEWSADGKSLYFTVEDDRVEYLARISAAGGKIEPLTTGRRVVGSVSLGPKGAVALLSSTANAPNEVHVVEGHRRCEKSRRTTTRGWARSRSRASRTSPSPRRTAPSSTACSPGQPARRPGKLPLVLWIHGGPNGQDDHSFDDIREILAANGFAVLQVNYRGGSGRGAKYQKAIYADWGNLEVVDLLAGVDWAIKSGVADPDRLGIGGWSYGGILTNYTIATDPRFKAAASGAGSSLQMTMYGIGPVHPAVRHRDGAAVEEPGRLGEGELPVLQGRSHQDADALHVRAERLQRAHRRQRADVPGAQEQRRRRAAGRLSRARTTASRHRATSAIGWIGTSSGTTST